MFFLLPLLLLTNCFILFFFKKWLGPFGLFFSSTLVWSVTLVLLAAQLHFTIKSNTYLFVDMGRWFFVLDILDSNLLFVIDFLSLLTSLLVITLTIFAQYFGIEYMYREAFIMRLLYLLNMFATSVIFLFFVFDFFLILVVWELIGLFSLLLVNFYSVRVYTLKAALKTFIFSRLSDFFIFTVFLFLVFIFNTTDLSVLFLQIPFFLFYNLFIFNWGFNLLNILALSVLLSASIKAAQFFFHVWLPDAMEAPTPASALIHSSTLVIMGIFLIIRFNIFFEFSVIANLIMALGGGCTIAFGSVVAAFQNDIKKLVAYSTISQMGYLFCGCGFMCYTEVIFYLAIHALNKAFLFILVGYIVHYFYGNTDLRFMGSLYLYFIDFAIILLFISLNLTGLPLTSGFLSKEFLLFQTFRDGWLVFVIRGFWFVSFIFTPVYMLLLNINVMFGFKKAKPLIYSTNYLNTFIKFYSNTTKHLDFKNSQITSRFGVFVFTILFFINNFIGEFFIFSMFEITLPNSFLPETPASNQLVNQSLTLNTFTAFKLNIISLLITFIFTNSLRLLVLFKNISVVNWVTTTLYLNTIFIISLLLL